MKKSVVIAFAVASLVCLLFVAISLATPVWLEITVPVIPFVTKTVATYGLFEYCRDDELAVWVCVDQTCKSYVLMYFKPLDLMQSCGAIQSATRHLSDLLRRMAEYIRYRSDTRKGWWPRVYPFIFPACCVAHIRCWQ